MDKNNQINEKILTKRQASALRSEMECERNILNEQRNDLQSKIADLKMQQETLEARALEVEKQEELLNLDKAKWAQDSKSAQKALQEELARHREDALFDMIQALRSVNDAYSAYMTQLKTQLELMTEAACKTAAGVFEEPDIDGAERFEKELAEAMLRSGIQGKSVWAQPVDHLLSRSLVTVTSLDELRRLGSYGFRNNLCIKRIELPEGLKEIPPSFFFGCANLREVVLPMSVQKIGAYAFYGCNSLQKINLSICTELKHIDKYAFSLCGSLHKLSLPESVQHLDTGAFRFCENLEELHLPSSIQSFVMGSHALQYCKKLKKMRLPSVQNQIQTSAFYGCEAMIEVVGLGVQSICAHAFNYCKSLKRAVFAQNAVIDNTAFLNSNLSKAVKKIKTNMKMAAAETKTAKTIMPNIKEPLQASEGEESYENETRISRRLRRAR